METRKLICPSCETALKVAASLAPGKKIRCPKCDAGFRVPDEDEPASPVTTAKARTPAAVDEDDFDEGPDDRPRPVKRKGKPTKSASSLPLVLGLGVGALLLGGGVTAAVVFWPKKPDTNLTASGGEKRTGAGEALTGREIYDRNGCARCHQIDDNPSMGAGVPGGKGGKGGKGGRPVDLRTVGAKHDLKYLMDHVRDPKSHKPQSRMGPYGEDTISASELKTLGEYLAGLK